MLIAGDLVGSETGAVFENQDPTTEECLGLTSNCSHGDAERAIAAARLAFDRSGWSTDAAFRRHCLEQLHRALDESQDEFNEINAAEAGVPIARSPLQVGTQIRALAEYARLAEEYPYEVEGPSGAGWRTILRREPVGVVSCISTWNCGFYLNLIKLAPALAVGCTVVLKPAPETPWQATLLGRLVAERTDIPPGVVNVITSDSPKIGMLMTSDPRVDMVSFTGSTAVGTLVMAQASKGVKRLFLELGGKSANIMLDDADFSAIVPSAAAAVCGNAGQSCANLSRLLVPRPRYEEAVELAVVGMSGVHYGDPFDMQTTQGPQITERHQHQVLAHIARAKADGCRIVAGGQRPKDVPSGYFVEPTLIADVSPEQAIAQDEIFGPVLSVLPFDSDEDAIRIANDSIYGLSGAVHSADQERALSVARAIRTGTISVNGGSAGALPFGGVKQSGIGRERGLAGLEEYTELKGIGLPSADH